MNFIRPRSYFCFAQSACGIDILVPLLMRIRGLRFTVAGIGLASITLLCFNDSGMAWELPQQQIAQITSGSRSNSQANVLFVNPTVGEQRIGSGSEDAPFKTITQALKVAEPNTVIVLANGTYSEASGEKFPLRLKSGVSIQGDSRTRGSNIVIQGGGTFLSPTFARQNITILGANQATLRGVTVINPHPRGYGLWIESSSPVVTDNTFTKSSHDGISLTGNSAPIIRSNYFYENGANGITIYGTSQPEVRENVFEKTGFGINVAQKAAPILVGNRITQNRSGIVIQAKARPVLRDNVIEGNTEDGLVAIASSQPDLGTKKEPGGNVFRQNGRYDINTSASQQVISAFGNQLANAQISGSVDLAGKVSVVATQDSSRLARISQNEAKEIPPVLQPKSAQLSPSVSRETHTKATASSIIIPVPPPNSSALSRQPQKLSLIPINSSTPNQREDRIRTSPGNMQLPPASGSDTATQITVPPTVSKPLAPPIITSTGIPILEPAKIAEADLLPVPSGNIPIGNSRNLPTVNVPRNSRPSAAGGPPLPPTRATSLGLRYRVVVEAATESKQNFVRSLIPGAFRTFSNGRVFMQVGAFSDRAKADEVIQLVNSKGLKAILEQLQ